MSILKISEATTIALHVATILAETPQKKYTAKELAKTISASEAHLVKVMQRLNKYGLVKAERGPKGGFMLDKAPEDISLLEVYEAIEGPITETKCLLGTPICGEKGCLLGDLIKNVHKSFSDYMSRTKLSDLSGTFRNVG